MSSSSLDSLSLESLTKQLKKLKAALAAKANRDSDGQRQAGLNIGQVVRRMKALRAEKGILENEPPAILAKDAAQLETSGDQATSATFDGFGSLFEEPASGEGLQGGDDGMVQDAAAQKLKPPHPVEHLVECECPGSWTGPAPRQLLREVLRRGQKGKGKGSRGRKGRVGTTEKFISSARGFTPGKSRHAFDMVYNNITVEMPPGHYCRTKEEAKNYVSLLALYRLVPDQPVHVRLPPQFRELWLGWHRADAEASRANAEAKQRPMNDFVHSLHRVANAYAKECTEEEKGRDSHGKEGMDAASSRGNGGRTNRNQSRSSSSAISLDNIAARRRANTSERVAGQRQLLPAFKARAEIANAIRDVRAR